MGCRLVGCGLSPKKWVVADCRLWVVAKEMGCRQLSVVVVADEMGKGGAHGLLRTVLVGAGLGGQGKR
jgi:hypothetical protein